MFRPNCGRWVARLAGRIGARRRGCDTGLGRWRLGLEELEPRTVPVSWNATSLSLFGHDIGAGVTPNGHFFASDGFDLKRSVNQGSTWQTVSPSASFAGGAIAHAPSNPSTLIAGRGHGTLKSVDGGASWFTLVDLNAGPAARAVVFRPDTELTVFAGVGYGWGLYKSTNGGATWTNPLSSRDVFAVAVDPLNPQVLYVGSQTYSPYPSGVVKSLDGGSTWSPVLPNTEVSSIAVDPADPQRVFVGTKTGGVYRSTNGGSTWAELTGSVIVTPVSALAFDPQTSSHLYAATSGEGMFYSPDGGATWTADNQGLSDLNLVAMAVQPASPYRILATTYGGKAFWAAANPGGTPTVTLSAAPATVSEAGGTATVTATLSAAASQIVTVALGFGGTATNGTDFTRSGTSIVIPAGSLNGSITLTGVNDALDEANETVVVDITGVTNGTESGTQQVTVTLTDDDPPPSVTLGLAGNPMTESGGTATVTATLSAASGLDVTVNLGFAGTALYPADYTYSAASVVIPAGSLSRAITVTAVDDVADEPNRLVVVYIAGVTNGTEAGNQDVTATILDNDPPPVTNDTWVALPPLPTGRNNAGFAALGGTVYVVGGMTGNNGIAAAQAYTAAGTWTTVPPLPTARGGLTAAAVNGKLYAIGGWNPTQSLYAMGTVEVFDPATNSWSARAPLPSPRAYLASAVVGDKIYVLGGQADLAGNSTTDLQVYDPATDTWSTKAGMPTSRRGEAAVALNGRVYAIGGRGGSADAALAAVEVYDPSTNQWSAAAPLRTPRGYVGAAEAGGKIYVLGGWDIYWVPIASGLSGRAVAYDTNEVYDPAAAAWSTRSTMPTARYGPAVVAAGGWVYAIGGSDTLATAERYLPSPQDVPPPTVQFAAAAQAAGEAAGTMIVTVALSAAYGLPVTVPFSVGGTATGGGVDYSVTAGPLTIPAGATTATITITVVNEALCEANETVVVTLGTPTNATLGSTSAHTATILDNDPPAVQSAVVNGGAAQRSMVTSLAVTFNGVVTLAAGTFEIRDAAGSPIVSILNVSTQLINDRTVATLTFSGTGIIGGSLADGAYTLTVRADRVSSAGRPMAADYTLAFFRLFGDGDGNRAVDADDLDAFGMAYGTAAGDLGYLAWFDFNGDGVIDADDLDAFGNRYGSGI